LDKVQQGFEAISWDGVLNGCIGALDGYLQCIAAPFHKECGNLDAYFSVHYCVYGVNIQAMCDADCRFLFVSVAAPGKTNDSVAIQRHLSKLGLKHCLLGVFFATDCAYSLSEHLITPYSDPQRYSECSDNFNFFIAAMNPNWDGIWTVGHQMAHSSHTNKLQAMQHEKNCYIPAFNSTTFALTTENWQKGFSAYTKSASSIFIHMSQIYWGMFQVMHQTSSVEMGAHF
jgi:hypothetical protein